MSRWFSYVSRKEQPAKGVCDKWLVTSYCFAKENTDVSPYAIANEWICGTIGAFLGMPIPSFVLYRENKRSKGMFGSHDYRVGDDSPPDVNPLRCVQSLPLLCAGIVVFDIFIGNADRHGDNLKVDDELDPKEVIVFDHERALLGGIKGEATNRLRSLSGRLGMSGGSVSAGHPHCLLEHLTSAEHLWYWVDRVQTMPPWFIEDVCTDACVPKRLAKTVAEFLRLRRIELPDIIAKNRDKFPGIASWGLLF